MAEIKQWFMSMPPITRAWFGVSVALPIIGRFGILNPYFMILTQDVIYKLQASEEPSGLKTNYQLMKCLIFFTAVMETNYSNILLPANPGDWVSLPHQSILFV